MSLTPKTEKLQKILAQHGFGSRREIEAWIRAGRIQVNGQVATIGDRISLPAKIQIDEKIIRLQPPETERRVLIYHKPGDEICSRKDPEGRDTVFSRLPRLHHQRWVAIGRLDLTTTGLLLFTNDGELAHRLLHPRYQIEREYAVRVLGKVDDEKIQRLLRGVQLEDGKAAFCEIKDAGGSGANHWYHVMLKEGRNHEVKRLWETQGIKVSRLIRVRFGPISLPRFLRPGKWQELSSDEIAKLAQLVEL